MRTLLRTLGAMTAVACVLLGTSSAWAAGPTALAAKSFGHTTCSGGTIAPGTYVQLTITGFCTIGAGSTVTVQGGLVIGENAALDAGIQAPTLIVHGGVVVKENGTFVLGCSPAFAPPCPGTVTNDQIYGGVRAVSPLGLLFHSNTIRGGLTLTGGGGGVNCNPNPIFGGGPIYSTFEDNNIFGKVVVSGYQSCWFGFIRNQVHGSVTLRDNILADPDAMEVVTNTIWGKLACFDNDPHAQIGDSGGSPNVVHGKKLGECATL